MDSVSLLTGLLQHFSPTGAESEAVNYLVGAMQLMGFQSYVDSMGNAVGKIGQGSREIVLLGHIDTVPGEISVRQEDNILFGRGAVDAKGPLASFVAAASACRKSSDWHITVIGAVGEEGDSRGAKFLCQNYPAPEMVVIGEPSGWEAITLGYKGSLWVELGFRQPASHTASGQISACDCAVIFWNQLAKDLQLLNEGKNRAFDRFSPSIRSMKFNSNGFEDYASLKINIRLPQGTDFDALQALFTACIETTHITPEISILDYMPPYLAEKNTSLVRAFLSGIRKNGGTPGFKLKTGTADMNLVGPAWNCPAIAYGAGDSNLDHTANEHIELPEYLLGIQVLKDSLEKIQGIQDNNSNTKSDQQNMLANAKQLAKDKKPDTIW